MIQINDSNYEEILAQDKPVIIDFWAQWCGPCKAMMPSVHQLADEYEGRIIVGSCDVDDNDELPGEYGIMNIPTLLFFKNGQLQRKTVGLQPIEALRQYFEELL